MVFCSFVDDAGRDVPAVATAEMRQVDRIAIEETGPNLAQMMENAGRSTAMVVRQMLGESWNRDQIVVLAGTGGNGGGGLSAARHLVNHGATVTVVVTNPERLEPVPAQQLRLFKHAGGSAVTEAPEWTELIIDAVIGYSLSGPPRGRALELIEYATEAPAPVLSLDVPSGLDATTGETPGAAIAATVTVTLALPKLGLCSPLAGDVILADIGIPAETYRRLGRVEAAAVFDGRYLVPLRRNLSA